MSVGPGTRLGPYEIAAKLGEGGMGEVYRAKDSHLGRDVAPEVVPEASTFRFGDAAGRRPDPGGAPGVGALPLTGSLLLARQIAEALEEAHDKGIVHRDL